MDLSVYRFCPFHAIGINAAAIAEIPLSVANKLNCAAAFLVSCMSTRIPISLIRRLVAGEIGKVEAPSPRINRSDRSVIVC